MLLRAETFEDGGRIPDRHSAYHDDLSPALDWEEVPEEARSLALIVDDPDAPRETPFVHWVIYNIPSDGPGIPEDLPRDERMRGGIAQGRNDRDRIGYFGPRPPEGHGVHHYHFKLYALDTELDLEPGATKDELLEAMRGHVLAEAEMVGTYEKP
jgi:Raf kinase inhibitor-like YbhB/YbcL family protein